MLERRFRRLMLVSETFCGEMQRTTTTLLSRRLSERLHLRLPHLTTIPSKVSRRNHAESAVMEIKLTVQRLPRILDGTASQKYRGVEFEANEYLQRQSFILHGCIRVLCLSRKSCTYLRLADHIRTWFSLLLSLLNSMN